MRNAGQGKLGGCVARTPVRAGAGVRRLAWPALAALTALAASVPLWSSNFLPFQDAPQHMFQRRSRWFQFDPYTHFGMYYEVERGGRARYNFAEVPWTPIRFRADALPVPEPPKWFFHPERFDSRRHASDAEYVLTRGGPKEPGQPFALLERAGPWSLYAKWRRAGSAVIHPGP